MKADMKAAMKAREKDKLQTIRSLLSSLKNARIDKGDDLDEDEVISVLSTEAKKRREAAEMYADGGRDELAEKEEAEIKVIEEYLPEQMTDDEAEALVDEAIESTGASSKADMGKVMGYVMPKIKGRYEGSKMKDIVLGKL
ncbi:GatB/YqeY domain-containing protein [Persicimonas caeni]|uniref:GatB/YqeY domain-containing protein n=2 Tax=Persicimonas caeni TaxID=2292766 RepID=A0A4Y6Q2Y7_PERCE|nr:GatB/YqeY domain-containing protein [Persicimonas caeni]QED36114.1 GatB/YqeY domain-containing protein [Persicimonas caeni]